MSQRLCCLGKTGKVGDAEQLSSARMASFPDTVRIWVGGDFKLLGSGIKYRKIAFFNIQLYSVALYVEEAPAIAELKRLQKAGFFKDYTEDTLCRALLAGSFKKLLQIQLLRNVTYTQFTDEIGRDLQPRLAQTGDQALWTAFESYFRDKDLSKGSNLLALWKEDGGCEGGLFPPGYTDFEHGQVGLSIANPHFAAALFDVYAGTGGIVPDARKEWSQGVLSLLNVGELRYKKQPAGMRRY